MHCETSSKPRIDLTLTGHPRAVHVAALRFIRGVRGPRAGHVTRKEIGAWLAFTPAEAIDAALVDLIAEGAIACVALSLRTPRNSARRAHGYEARE